MSQTIVAVALILAISPVIETTDVDFFSGRTPGLSSAEIERGWLSLFDGKSMYGWRAETSADWQVKDGAIQVTSGQVGLLRTPVQFDDFELKLEFKGHPDTNSGIFIRSNPRPVSPLQGCIEINIASESLHEFPTGSIVGRCKANDVELKSGFNSMRIVAKSHTITVEINGVRVSEYSNVDLPGKGYIGLQHNHGQVQFRNIAVRPVGLEPMLGGDLSTHWNLDRKQDSQFSLKNGLLSVKQGRGQLESNQRFRDFVFSTHVRTNAVGLNSGVFFRCIPGDLMNGYESQIQNQFLENDPTRPVDHGTGGIFRRKNARIVNASDKHWFSKTIVADGATCCVWVNGLLVTDWTDQRRPHENPRKGRRLEAGTIIIQGHDPTTDLSFKSISIRELSPRK